ncbi:MAG: hypothetical protein IPK13_24180 [Deltaproteobacteria bacterium]|nr:hypothetical protein [Deltaproteobacteria bacterium]
MPPVDPGVGATESTDAGGPDRDREAQRLAARVATLSGLPELGQIAQLNFTFIAIRDGRRAMEARHRWDIRGGRDRITWSRDGHTYDVIVSTSDPTRVESAHVDGAPASPAVASSLGPVAYQRFINDGYWLLMPLKLFDDGVILKAEPDRIHDDVPHHILRLSFAGVGLTPGDVYWLFINPNSNRITRWEMRLEGQTSEPRGMSWDDYRPVGPLLLSHLHQSDDGKMEIRFDETSALRALQSSDFEPSKLGPGAPDRSARRMDPTLMDLSRPGARAE